MKWHQQSIEELYRKFESSGTGLSQAEAAKRLGHYGSNTMVEHRRRAAFLLFLDQFRDFMIVVLLAAAVVAGIIGETIDAVVIVAIVILNALIGFLQEYRAEKAVEALKQLAAPFALTLREGTAARIPASELVPGDIVFIESGDIVPADLRLVHAAQLKIDESMLTGESVAADKTTTPLPAQDLPIGDRTNLCYKGTVVVYGRGSGMVVATGMQTELGRVAAMLGKEEKLQTPLQRRLTSFGYRLSLTILAVCLIFFVTGLIRGEGIVVMLLTAVSLAVAAIPEALPAVISVALALGARKLVAENALVRRLAAVETLGSVTYICSDKTGTLTENRLTVEKLYAGNRILEREEFGELDRELGAMLLAAMALCNDARVDGTGRISGDPTETALFAVAREQKVDGTPLVLDYPRIAEIPFASETKRMTTVHTWQGEVVAFTKGAPEAVVGRLTGPADETAVDRTAIMDVAAELAGEGLRVLALAMRRFNELPEPEEWDRELTFLGLVAMLDPPRAEAYEAVQTCRQAGITPVMITGDHPQTARAIASRLGIIDRDGAVISGDDLARLPLEQLEERVTEVRGYARVAPEQKLKLVKALQKRGEFVAMTGDGVNDAPALKRADIGIAMGVTGTDVAKEAADLILLDDNFATIVHAIREGRRIYDNIRKFIRYLLTTNLGEIIVIVSAPFFGLPMPLLPVQILWINLLTDALPALALSLEPAEGDLMKRPPRPPQESILSHGLGLQVVLVGLLISVLVLGIQAWSLRRGAVYWQTMTFTVLCFTQLFNVLAIRSERQSLFTIGLFSNKPILGAVLISACLQLATIYIPALSPIFRTHPLGMKDLALAAGVSSIVLWVVELEKLVRRRRVY